MNNIVRSISCFLIFVLFSSQSMAFVNKANNNSNLISVKCHVTFTTGTEDIIFWRIKSQNYSTFANDIVGREIEVAKHKARLSIYKVFQCVKQEDEFTSNQAKLLDSKQEDR